MQCAPATLLILFGSRVRSRQFFGLVARSHPPSGALPVFGLVARQSSGLVARSQPPGLGAQAVRCRFSPGLVARCAEGTRPGSTPRRAVQPDRQFNRANAPVLWVGRPLAPPAGLPVPPRRVSPAPAPPGRPLPPMWVMPAALASKALPVYFRVGRPVCRCHLGNGALVHPSSA